MKILMVCLGNICRSPLAEGLLQNIITAQNLSWTVDSAGTSGWHDGEPPHKGSIKVAAEHGININNQKSRKFTKLDFDRFDLILAMDSQNYQDIIKLAANKDEVKKVKIMLNYAHPNSNMAVPDPYYTGNFQEVYDLLQLACVNLVKEHTSDTF